MRALLDACVLFPTVTREVLLGVASAGSFRPLWSPRIVEEWVRATAKLGPGAEPRARAEAAALRAAWPRAEVMPTPAMEARLWLPDPNDVHVLAAAVDGGADLLVTFNKRDFPRREVDEWGVRVVDPDALLMDLWLETPEPVEDAANASHDRAAAAGHEAGLRALMKRAKLPRLGKALG